MKVDSRKCDFLLPAVIRDLKIDDLPRCLELSTEANWNQNEADWKFLLSRCRGYGFEGADGKLVGTTMAWEWGTDYSWINMVLVTTSSRGQGVARQLMEQCLRDVSAAKRGGLLDATDMGQRVYSKLGFAGEDRIVRLFSEERNATMPLMDGPEGMVLLPLSAEDIGEAARLDTQVLGVDRRVLLEDFQRRLPNTAWKLADREGIIRGFVLGRDGRVASQIGPLVATSREAATCLLSQALKHTPGPVMIDVPENETEWRSWLGGQGFALQRGFLRMGRDGAALPTDWSRVFAISGPDFA